MGEAERDISVALNLLWKGTLEIEFVSKTKNKNKELSLFLILSYHTCFYSVRCILILLVTDDLYMLLKEPNRFEL